MDQKSCWEVLTDPQFTQKYFSADERQVFRRHVLWTRIVREARTTGFDGEEIDLLPWMRRNKDRLVLKPNRSFGGAGILVGPHVDLATWDGAREKPEAQGRFAAFDAYKTAVLGRYR